MVDFNFGELDVQYIDPNNVVVKDTAIRKVDPKKESYINLVEDLRRGNPIHDPIYVKLAKDQETGIEYYELCDGGHRLAASLEVGNDTIPAFVLPEDTPRTLMLGLQFRKNHLRIAQTATQEAAQYQRILAEDPNLSIEDLAKLVGYSVATVKDKLKFTDEHLTPEVINLVDTGKISTANARELSKAGKSLQSGEILQSAQIVTADELKSQIAATKKALSGAEEPKAKESKKEFEPKYKVRDRSVIEKEIESGALSQIKYNDPAQQEAFLEGVKWAVSLDEQTVTEAREEFELKIQEAERLKAEKELAKTQKKIAELEAKAAAAVGLTQDHES